MTVACTTGEGMKNKIISGGATNDCTIRLWEIQQSEENNELLS